ncbi:hypothetical protein [Pantoea ananatis]|uniref:hypothetical protein n=1 Tax=Pantoea ananas TaxID=553 RepID=UPI001EE5D250|nr:hypothetical protein [Pantoea ananatis]PKC45611.1 hypothetical protein V461_05810 [Pantoea ananatis BRT98]
MFFIKNGLKVIAVGALMLSGQQSFSFAKTQFPDMSLRTNSTYNLLETKTKFSGTELAAWHHHFETNHPCNDPSSGLGCNDDENA